MLKAGVRDVESKRPVLTCRECFRRKQKCDRLRPCSNCITRQVENRCLYSDSPRKSQQKFQANVDGTLENFGSRPAVGATSTEKLDISSFGYSSTNENNALASLMKLQLQFKELDIFQSSVHSDPDFALKTQYESMVLRLPPKSYSNGLVSFFFDNVNDWQYSIVEPHFFQTQLDEWWDCIPHLPRIGHPRNLPNDDEYFPALLFQVIALALQFLPPTFDMDMEPLKQGKSLNALSAEFSNLGCALLGLLGRQRPTLSSIQHDLLRSAWLKNADIIPESWHTLGQAIRQAQEIGLHELGDAKLEETESLADRLSHVWRTEYKKRVWLNLFMWDIQMAMMLGRPATVDLNSCTFSPPLNCLIPQSPSETIPQELREGDRPSAFTERLLQYRITLLIIKTTTLRANRRFPRDPSIVDTLHRQAFSILDSIPATLRHQNPDTTWDLQCPFLLHQRELLLCVLMYYLLSLHRPHIPTSNKSKEAALQAAFMVLESQQRLFKILKPQYYKLHSVTFFNFDASLQLAVILLSEPVGHNSILQRALQSIGTAISRLEVLAGYSALAKAGVPLIQALYQKLQTNMRSEQESIDAPELPNLNAHVALGSNSDMVSSSESEHNIDTRLWAFDSDSTRLSLNLGREWELGGNDAWNMPDLTTYPVANDAFLPYASGQTIAVNNLSGDISGVDTWTPANEFTDQDTTYWRAA